MRTIYIVIGFLAAGGFIYFLTNLNDKAKVVGQVKQESEDTYKPHTVDMNNNPYTDLRNLALEVTADQLGVQVPAEETKIYGLLMDWDLGDGTATLVCFISGDASLYLSSGGGIIGGIGHDNIKQASVAFIDKAENYLSKTTKTEITPLPGKDEVLFYFLTNKGKLVGQEQMKNFENNSSDWLDLFEEGNKVITDLRNSSPDK